MDDNMQDKITEIGKMFGIEGIPDNAGALLSAFLNSSSSAGEEKGSTEEDSVIEVASETETDTDSASEETSGSGLGLGEILSLMETYRTITGEIKNDEKARLLQSLKPFLNSTRQEKVGNCMKFLAVARFLEHKDELSAVGGKFFSF